jgi:N utilization substance protein B
MQALFETEFPGREGKVVITEALDRIIQDREGDEIDAGFAHRLLEGVIENKEAMLKSVQDHAPQWPLDRMEAISRTLLMMGTYEILYGNDAPPPVVMDEAIEIAKSFSEEESGKFVNGVLNAIAKDVKTQ